MLNTQRSKIQPKGEDRAKPGERGEGDYYRVVVRDKNQFKTFRYHDVGEKNGDLKRLAGKRESGSWDTQAWLINKKSAHIERGVLRADTEDAEEALEQLGSKATHVKGDIFRAKDRPNVAEEDKPTKEQKAARSKNIKKAQEARRM